MGIPAGDKVVVGLVSQPVPTLTCHHCPTEFAGDSAEHFRRNHEWIRHRVGKNPSPPSQRHSATSVQAASEIHTRTAELREKVYDYLKAHGPATDEQVQEALGMNPNTQRPRRIELVDLRRVRDSQRTAKTRSGRDAVLWRIVN